MKNSKPIQHKTDLYIKELDNRVSFPYDDSKWLRMESMLEQQVSIPDEGHAVSDKLRKPANAAKGVWKWWLGSGFLLIGLLLVFSWIPARESELNNQGFIQPDTPTGALDTKKSSPHAIEAYSKYRKSTVNEKGAAIRESDQKGIANEEALQSIGSDETGIEVQQAVTVVDSSTVQLNSEIDLKTDVDPNPNALDSSKIQPKKFIFW